MKRSYQKLSLEIRELKNKYVIIVEDNTKDNRKFSQRFECCKGDKNLAKETLDNAKEWLWNMGLYNGQANEMMRKFSYEWYKELNII